MKKKLQKLKVLIAITLLLNTNLQAQLHVTVDASAAWIGYMNWFDLSNNYENGSFWALPAVKSTLSTTTNSITLQPNFNTVGDAIASGDPGALAYWTNGTGGGNKIMDGLTFTEPAGAGGQTVTFAGLISSNNLDPAYTAVAFIKILDPNIGYAQTFYTSAPLGAVGTTFSISAAIPASPSNLITQTGFSIRGINANPTAEAALGSITVIPSAPLSLDLQSFTAELNNSSAQLNWLTNNEENMKVFEVEKSSDASNFTTIGSVEAKNLDNQKYSFTDAAVFGNTYYRLKMVEQDGSFKYSSIVMVSKVASNTVNIFPNPATKELSITTKANIGNLQISNTQGAVLINKYVPSNYYKLDVSSLPNGTYFINVNNKSQQAFIKQ